MFRRLKLTRLFAMFLIINLVFAAHAISGTINAISCSQADVQAAINSASNGDTVNVPAGSCTWASPVTIPSSKGITLSGAGIDQTIITSSVSSGNALSIAGKEGNPTRLNGFTFKGSAGNSWISLTCEPGKVCTNCRIDHNKFDSLGGRAIHVNNYLYGTYGLTYGVIDHNQFVGSVPFPGILVTGENEPSWSKPLSLGTANATYIEDNTFSFSVRNEGGAVAVDCNFGGRFVFRHNTLTSITIATHDFCEYDGRGAFSWEIYNNTFNSGSEAHYRAINNRGGTGVVFNNTFTGTWSKPICLTNYRSCVGDGTSCNYYNVRCDGQSSYDGNTSNMMGYPCRDQIGRSTNQSLEPVYEWNNLYNGSDADITLHNFGACDAPSVNDHIQKNRDYYDDTPRPGYTSYTYPHPAAAESPDNPPGPPDSPVALEIIN